MYVCNFVDIFHLTQEI